MSDRSYEEYYAKPGPYLARIVGHADGKFMGTLEVQLLNETGQTVDSATSVIKVRYLSPFYGVTGVQFLGKNNDYNGTQKSYGMWMIPPDVGSLVMVMFVEGHGAFWVGCVQDEYMNFMVPGLAATETNLEGGKKVVAEFNKETLTVPQSDATQIKKPVHIFQKVLDQQGLGTDDVRGLTSSSARRDLPSAVFGISTPGPVDRRPGAPKGPIGKRESRIESAFISRLGGSTFVMDDGDDSFLRKTKAGEGPPVYANVDNGEKGGQPDIPHNELIRLRTRTGHQILLHSSEDLIYIGNARGTTWIELTSNGKIDIFAEDSVSIHTKQDLNIKADRDINMEAGRNVNIRAGSNHYTEVGAEQTLIVGADQKIKIGGAVSMQVGADRNVSISGTSNESIGSDFNIISGGDAKLTANGDYDLKTGGDNHFTAGGDSNVLSGGNIAVTGAKIDLNGPAAAAAVAATQVPITAPSKASVIAVRVPEHEPWAGHENLHGSAPGPTTATDTFKKISR
jgi:hypothetical protein